MHKRAIEKKTIRIWDKIMTQSFLFNKLKNKDVIFTKIIYKLLYGHPFSLRPWILGIWNKFKRKGKVAYINAKTTRACSQILRTLGHIYINYHSFFLQENCVVPKEEAQRHPKSLIQTLETNHPSRPIGYRTILPLENLCIIFQQLYS